MLLALVTSGLHRPRGRCPIVVVRIFVLWFGGVPKLEEEEPTHKPLAHNDWPAEPVAAVIMR